MRHKTFLKITFDLGLTWIQQSYKCTARARPQITLMARMTVWNNLGGRWQNTTETVCWTNMIGPWVCGSCMSNSIKLQLWPSQQGAESDIADHDWCTQIHTSPSHGNSDRSGESRKQKRTKVLVQTAKLKRIKKTSNTQKNVWDHKMQNKENQLSLRFLQVRGPAHAATFAYCNPQYRACNNRRPPCSKPAGLAGGLQGDRENFYPCKKVAVL